ncbi:hypothetical protein EX895_000063 [Sporisorium graminicola]|uniref:Restriction endonuclease type IV Mrr domain-containing protein n=1 Tax=Sporisorium graminicola TaxID=280036 RepID=A0A4U7KYW2_9BASI|nr:hypothetical protein EX895_000063 [Sporisorium graminicola]TKY90065.1 hypothetical protein EX895_000063 [Sporisorium graminicola]
MAISATRRRTIAAVSSKPLEDAESSVARGTRYEHLCGAVLREVFGMQLERTGGAGDRGIDLRGWWQPPPVSSTEAATTRDRRIRIVAQCKCQDEGGKKMGPVLIREMEGVVFRASSPLPSPAGGPKGNTQEASGDDDVPLAGIILSSSGFSKQALLQVRSSSVPLAAIHVLALPQASSTSSEDVDAAALVERCISIVWNDRFGSATHGLLDGGMEVRWVRSLSPRKAAEELLGRPVIYRAGKPLKK